MARTITVQQGLQELLEYKETNSTCTLDSVFDINLLIREGRYHASDVTSCLNFPYQHATDDNSVYIEVQTSKTTPACIKQIVTFLKYKDTYTRTSLDGGQTWTHWDRTHGSTAPYVNYICIATDGNDNNDGLSQNTPIRTIAELKRRLATFTGWTEIYFGPGNWGDLELTNFDVDLQISRLFDEGTAPYFSGIFVSNILSVTLDQLAIDKLEAGEVGSCYLTSCTLGIAFVYGFSAITLYGTTTIKSLSSEYFTAMKLNASNIGVFTLMSDTSAISLNGTVVLSQDNLCRSFLNCQKAGSITLGSSFNVSGSFGSNKYSYILYGTPLLSPSLLQRSTQYSTLLNIGQNHFGTFRSGNITYETEILSILSNTPTIIGASLQHTKGTTPSATVTTSSIQFCDSTVLPTDSLNDLKYKSLAAFMCQTTSSGLNCLQLRAYNNTANSDACAFFRLYSNGYLSCPSVYPDETDKRLLGSATLLWKDIYAVSGTINTSDERLKVSIADIPSEVLDAWEDVGLKIFQMKDSVTEKGTSIARWHTGVIAQAVQKAFQDHDLDVSRYGFFCYDSWEAEDEDELIEIEPEIKDESGNVIQEEKTKIEHHHTDAGERYSIRYTEALVIEAAYLRRKNKQLENRIAQLEAFVQQLATQVHNLQQVH